VLIYFEEKLLKIYKSKCPVIQQSIFYKINVKLIDAYMYHYGWVKPPKSFNNKRSLGDRMTINEGEFDFGNADRLVDFKGSHPQVMAKRIQQMDWNFNIDITKLKKHLSLRRQFLQWIEVKFGKRIFEYKNYKIVAKYD
jgi:hypothetical protein